MKRILLVLLGLALTVPVGADEQGSAAQPKSDSASVPDKAAKSLDAMADKARQERDAFVAKAQKDIDELNARIATLKSEAQKLGGEAKAKFDKQIKSLEREQRAAQGKLAKLKAVAGEKWRTLKADVSTAIDHLRQSVDKTKKSSD